MSFHFNFRLTVECVRVFSRPKSSFVLHRLFSLFSLVYYNFYETQIYFYIALNSNRSGASEGVRKNGAGDNTSSSSLAQRNS